MTAAQRLRSVTARPRTRGLGHQAVARVFTKPDAAHSANLAVTPKTADACPIKLVELQLQAGRGLLTY